MSTFIQRRVRFPVSYVRTRGCVLVEDYANTSESSGQKDDSADDSNVDEVDNAASDIASQEEVNTSRQSNQESTDSVDGPTTLLEAAFTLMTLSVHSSDVPTPDVTNSEAESVLGLSEDTTSDSECESEYDADESCGPESNDEYGLSDAEHNTSGPYGRIDLRETDGVKIEIWKPALCNQ